MELQVTECPRLALTTGTTRWIGLRNRIKRSWECGVQTYPPGQIPARHADALLTLESEDNRIRYEEWEAEKVEAKLDRG